MFKNPIETNSSVPDRREEDILQNISFLGSKLDELKAQESDYEDKTQALSRLNSSISYADTSLLSLQKQIVLAQEELDNTNRTHEQALSDGQKELSEVQAGVDSAKAELATVSDDLGAKKTELSQLESDIASKKEDSQNELAALDSSINEKSNERNVLLDDINNLNVSYTSLREKISAGQKTLHDINNELQVKIFASEQLDTDISTKQGELGKIESGNKAKIQIVDDEVNGRLASLKEREDREATREGANSDKEAWLIARQAELKSVKESLEEFYGRKLNNINL